MLPDIIAHIESLLDTVQAEQALTDRAVAAAVQLFIRTGSFPDAFVDNAQARSAVIETAWLLFLAAPARDPRYLLIASMHLDLVIDEDRELTAIFRELHHLPQTDDPELNHAPPWLAEYRQLGALEFPTENQSTELANRLDQARKILRDHHDEVLTFSRQVVDTLADSFDQDVRHGNLSPLGPDHSPVDDPQQALIQARTQRDAGDLEAAVHLFTIYLREFPDDTEILLERGILRASLEDLSTALEDFDAVLHLDPDHLIATLNRALARHSLGLIDAALKDYDRALNQVGDNAEIFTNRGIARFSAGDHQGALADLNRAIELDDRFPPAYLQRANVHRILGQVAQALNDYSRAITLQPDFVDAIAGRAFLHLQLEEVEKAIADFGLAIGLQPSDPSLYFNRAYARLLDQNIDGAIADYDQALALDPEDTESLANRGAAHMLNGDLDAAVHDWEEAIAIDPYYPTAYLKRASMWIATEQPEEAARDLQIALDNAPADWPHRHDVETTLQEILDDLGFHTPN